MKMTRGELEYAISQYIDGNLPPLERAVLDEQLANDAEARSLLAEYQKFNAILIDAMPLPKMAWDRFASRIKSAVEQEETPVRHFALPSIGWVRGLALAASIMLVVSVALHFAAQTPRATGVAVISGPAIEQTNGPVVAEIDVGPSPTVAANWRASEEVVSRPTVVLIDQARPSVQDSDLY
jgi:anti-sigma factor RsiW